MDGVCAHGKPVWQQGTYERYIFFSNKSYVGINSNYSIGNMAWIWSKDYGLSDIPIRGYEVLNNTKNEKNETSFVDDPELTIERSTSTKALVCPATTTTTTTTTSPTTVTMSPAKMEELDKHLTPKVECPTQESTEHSPEEPSKAPPAIDLFLNPSR